MGVAPCANVYGLKIFDDSGGNGYSSYIINALNVVKERHVSNPNAKSVVSMSLGGYCGTTCDSSPLMQLISSMYDLGILFSVAAGNDYNANACLYFPAASPKAVTVAASDQYDNFASYSSTGPCVDIIGPGSYVNSACATCTGKSSYVLNSGTSMATPHVAGALALLLQKKKVAFTTAPDIVITALKCDAAKNQIQGIVAQSFGTSVNLLVQVPKNDSSFGSCLTDPTAQPSFRSPTTTPIYKPSSPTTVYPNCGRNAWNCGTGGSRYTEQPPVVGCKLPSGHGCCCNWGMVPSGNLCGCTASATAPTAVSQPSLLPSRTPSTSPTVAVAVSTSAPTKTSTLPTNGPSASSIPTIKSTSSASTPLPSAKVTAKPTYVPTTKAPTAKSTTIPSAAMSSANPSTGAVVTVRVCGTSAFTCYGSDDPIYQPVIPGIVVATGGQCCCYWGYKPYINAGCTNRPV